MRFALVLTWSDGCLTSLCQSWRFACWYRVLKIFSGTGCLNSKNWAVWVWNLLENCYILINILSCYSSIHLALGLINRDGCFSTICHSSKFSCQQRGAKNVSWLWLTPLWGWSSLTVKFTGTFIYMVHHFILLWLNPFGLRGGREGWWFNHFMSVLRVC